METGAITWLGHATFRLETPSGETILVDPWLADNPSCPSAQHEQRGIDAILLTHGHEDHVGGLLATLDLNPQATVVAVLEAAIHLFPQGLSESSTQAMNLGGTVEIGGSSVSMVEAKHTSSLKVGDGIVYAGVPVGYVVALADGRSIYFAGDTALFGDLTLIGELYRPNLAVLPIGGHFTMDGTHAARAARMLGCEYVIPCHYQTFPMLAQDASSLIAGLGGAAKPQILQLVPGVPVELPGRTR